MVSKRIKTDFCVIGGGMAGLIAAISAARHGAKVVLVQDRPVLGGNASSEIRMWIRGAQGRDKRETGILEEILLENLYRNESGNFFIWDSILYEKVKDEKNIQLLLNTVCLDMKTKNNKISQLKAYQLTSETYYTIEGKYFADCSGDGISAPLAKANFMLGREAKDEFNESMQDDKADKKTMGHSILFQIRETDSKKVFIPPKFAYKYESENDLPNRGHDVNSNFWWIELGGEDDIIHDTEDIKDELLKIAFGVWDHMKNCGDHGLDNHVIEWIGFLPGKRESRRLVGDYILTQNDIESEGRFYDIVAYGGWPMDNHNPAGFRHKGQPTIYYPAPSPYGIPYRILYSNNIENLFFAGRNVSCTHAAMSSTRVMGTCSLLGQAVGTAAALCVKENLSPRQLGEKRIAYLQELLQDDDCYLPFRRRKISSLSLEASFDKKYLNLINGYDRPINDLDNGVYLDIQEPLLFCFDTKKDLNGIRMVFDSDLNRKTFNMPAYYPLNFEGLKTPSSLVKEFQIYAYTDQGKELLYHEKNNYQRLVKLSFHKKLSGLEFVGLSTWGDEKIHIFAIDIL